MKKPIYKRWWFIVVAALIVIYGLSTIAYLSDDEITAEDNNETVKTSATVEEKEEVKIDPLVEERDYYQSKIEPSLDDFIKEYDRIWSQTWVTTFSGISDGTLNVYEAYENMKLVESNYRSLQKKVVEFEGKELSKKNKKLLEGFTDKMWDASSSRAFAASEAAKMFDDGNYKPSELDDIKSIISSADSDMLDALVDRVTLETNLGITQEKE